MGGREARLSYLILGLALIMVLFGVWEWAGRTGRVSALALPVPSRVLVECARLPLSAQFVENWTATLGVWFTSLLLGLSAGLLLGFTSGASRPVSLAILPLVGYLRSVPPIALFPVALVALGPGNLPVGVVATLGAALYVFPGTAEAAREAAARFADLAKILGSSRTAFLIHFVAPGAAVQAVASSRVAATYAFAVCVAGEMIIGGRHGVGAAILDASERYLLEQAYAYVVYTGLVGLVIDLLFGRVSRVQRLGL
jgi:NitT/TauT family transport system permease protein